MSLLKRSGRTPSGPLPIRQLVRKAFRAGAFYPLLILAVLLAIGIPMRQVVQATGDAKNYAAVLEGVISDRASLLAEKAEGVAALIGRSADSEISPVARLGELLALNPSIEAALVTDSSGQVLAEVSDSIDRSPEAVVGAALRATVEDGANYVGLPQYNPALRAQTVVIAVPISSPGRNPIGMVQTTVSATWMLEAVRSTNENLGVTTFITDLNGRVLVHGDPWRVFAGQSIEELGNGIRQGLDGDRSIVGAVAAREWGGSLIAVSSVPISVIYTRAAIGLLPVLFILIAFIFSRMARRRLVKSVVTPVHELGVALGSYGPENLKVRMDDTEIEELNVVASAFNATADRMDLLVDSLKESNSRFQKLFEAAPVGMALHTIDGEYLNTNEVYDRMFGFRGDDMSLNKVIAMVTPESKETVKQAFAAIARREVDTVTFDGGFVTASGKTIWAIVTVTVLPQPGDAMDQLVAQVVDVTELKETQSKLEELLATKNQFLAAVSHELRTPLTAVIGLAELLRDPESDLSSDQRASLIDTIVESGFDVSNMVEDLLTAARQEAGQLSVVAVPVNMMAQTKQAIEVLDSEAGVAISGQGATAVADPGRVRQILRNLLTNALKYGGDHVMVRLDTNGDFARAIVIDDGPGVPPESSELIFRSYERAHAKELHPGSVGIGLSISRELARQMGGDLQYRRSHGRTHFELTLPLMTEESSADSVISAVTVSA